MKNETLRIQAPKLAIKIVGYINLIPTKRGKRTTFHASTVKTRRKTIVQRFASKLKLRAFQLLQKVGANLRKMVGITIDATRAVYTQMQINVQKAKNLLKLASLRHYTTVERFPLMVQFYKALQDVKMFRLSLPFAIRINLF
jgi:hypothetical protein